MGACSKKSTSTTTTVTGGSDDAATGNSDDAGGTTGIDAGGNAGNSDDGGVGPVLGECFKVDPGSYNSTDLKPTDKGSGITTPSDLVVTRAVTSWSGSCKGDPALVIKLSSGLCPDGDGHELELDFSAKALNDKLLGQGQNNIYARPDSRGIKVTYVRGKRQVPSGVWGNCAGATGQVVLPDAVDIRHAGAAFKARVLLSLTDCVGHLPLQTVNGWINVKLRRGFNDVCPAGTP